MLAARTVASHRGCSNTVAPVQAAIRPRPCFQCRGTTNNHAPSSRLQYEPKNYELVSDAMTSDYLYTCTPDETIDSALEKLVQHRVTGLPVVDDSDKVVGVVSDYDLLALDKLGTVRNDKQLFPQADETWQAFKEVKRLLAKSSGKRISDVMTATPITVHPETSLDEAAMLLLAKKIHRLPVVDEQGKLVGVLSRGNLVKAALAVRKAAAAEQEQ
eukprot:GHUV01002275.1.p1 GENE.GHUV01002275.1~~GHUV01002275.1.p1  ORF type:complete len:215 (+),score=49.83 GHUV01002275.1:130-774(+)